jgi:hypothetical protein
MLALSDCERMSLKPVTPLQAREAEIDILTALGTKMWFYPNVKLYSAEPLVYKVWLRK